MQTAAPSPTIEAMHGGVPWESGLERRCLELLDDPDRRLSESWRHAGLTSASRSASVNWADVIYEWQAIHWASRTMVSERSSPWSLIGWKSGSAGSSGIGRLDIKAVLQWLLREILSVTGFVTAGLCAR